MKILIVEDDGFRIVLFRQWLRGHNLYVASQARQAIRLLRKHTFDVMFLDHDLGSRVLVEPSERNSGAEVARFIAARGLQVRTIVHSHNAAGAAYLLALLPQATAVPFGDELREKLSSLLASVVE